MVYNLLFTNLEHKWIIFLPGLPQYMHKQSYLKQLMQDYNVLIPYYPGSFHSGKKFTPKYLERVIPDCIKIIKDKVFYDYFERKKYTHSGEIEGIWGLSFGSILITQYLTCSKQPLNTNYLLAGPMFILTKELENKYWVPKLTFLQSKVYSKVYRGLNSNNLIAWIHNIEKKNIPGSAKGLILTGDNDTYMDLNFLKEKFSNFVFKSVRGYSHEVDNIISLYIESGYNINKL